MSGLKVNKRILYIAAALLIGTVLTFALLGSGLLLSSKAPGLTIELFSGEPRTVRANLLGMKENAATDISFLSFSNQSIQPQLLAQGNDVYTEDAISVWDTDTQVDIFKVSYVNGRNEITVSGNGDKVIAPGTGNIYEFRLKNNSSSYGDYKVMLEAFFTNNDGITIPVEARFSGAGGYLIGSESEWRPVCDLNGLEDSGTLEEFSTAIYTLEWRWPFDDGEDTLDTFLGNMTDDEAMTLTIRIMTEANLNTASLDWGTSPVPAPIPSMLNGKDHFAYIFGYEDGNIHPEDDITRAQTAVIFYRLLNDRVRDDYYCRSSQFYDVADGMWYSEAIATLSNMGILRGYPDGSFRPNSFVSRAEFAAICSRLADVQTIREKTDFNDIRSHWAEKEITLCEKNGWLTGYEDNTFRPDSSITRAEAVMVVNRILHRLPERVEDMREGMAVWSDNSDKRAWYYIAIQEASNDHDYRRGTGTREFWTGLKNKPEDLKLI